MIRDGRAYEELLLEEGNAIQLPSEEAFKHLDRRTCDCEKPIVMRSAMPMVGTGVLLRLCCLAKEIEQRFGFPPGTFYQVYEFPPSWEWDSESQSVTREVGPDGVEVENVHLLGQPPAWIQERMTRKGIAWK